MRSLKPKLTKTARPFSFETSLTNRRFYTKDSSDPPEFRLKNTQLKKPATHDRDMNTLDLPIRDPIEAQRKPQRTHEEVADVLRNFLRPSQNDSKSIDIGSIGKSINSNTRYGKSFKRFSPDQFASRDVRSSDGSFNWSADRRYPKASQPLPFSRPPTRTDAPIPKRDWKSPGPPPWPKHPPTVEKPAQSRPRRGYPDQPFRRDRAAPPTTPTPIRQPSPPVAPVVADPRAPAEIIEPEVIAEEIEDLTNIGNLPRPKSKPVKRDDGRSISKRERFLKKEQENELDDDELVYDEFELSAKKKKKMQVIKVEEKLKKEVYLPEAISVANLAKIIGLRLGKGLKQMFVMRAYYLISHN
ncbi:6931_t:CDS:1 [Paraglomus brasilianum]|uniref:6931_t:CDS:1 n=1 Tax=Paraglomus brasilianum TaxID=144538 RepID=A0A9N9BDS9_9GLOM|nr:6931_t:CDS:1 [Paraglomus brasilianum]